MSEGTKIIPLGEAQEPGWKDQQAKNARENRSRTECDHSFERGAWRLGIQGIDCPTNILCAEQNGVDRKGDEYKGHCNIGYSEAIEHFEPVAC